MFMRKGTQVSFYFMRKDRQLGKAPTGSISLRNDLVVVRDFVRFLCNPYSLFRTY